MRIAILSRNPNLYSTRRLKEAGEALGHTVDIIDTMHCYMDITSSKPAVRYQGKPLPKYDAVIPRIGASVTFYGTSVVRQFEMMGTFSINESVAISRSRDKLRSLQLLSRKGIGLPRTGFAHHPDKIDAHEFLKFVHTINYDCLEKDVELREELLKLDVKAYCATNGSREHAMNCMKKIGIDDLFEGKVMDIVDFNFKPKPNPESLKLLCDNFQIPTNEETVYVEDICKNLTSETAKNMIKVWFSNDEPINNIDKYKNVVDYKIDNLALFLKKIRLLKEQ